MSLGGGAREAAIRWAASYNAYERLAAAPHELEALLEPVRREFEVSGRVPSWCGVDLLRGWAFYLYRSDYFAGGGSLGPEWWAVLDALRLHPSAIGDDLPPSDTAPRFGEARGATSMARVLGVDACPGGWVGVVVDGAETTVLVHRTIDELVAAAVDGGGIAVVGVDMPIGLPDVGQREADRLARARVGARASSVFTTPVRAALEAPSQAEAVEVNRAATGAGISIQAYGLRTKLFEVDRWARAAGRAVIEVHPEVSFAEMNGRPLDSRKAIPEGEQERRALLNAHGVVLHGELKRPGAQSNDVLDAAAAAWTARRYAGGGATSLPDPPEVFADGWPAAIWV